MIDEFEDTSVIVPPSIVQTWRLVSCALKPGCKPWTTEEQYRLLRRYLAVRHPGGGMAEMDEGDFSDMVEQTPVRLEVDQ